MHTATDTEFTPEYTRTSTAYVPFLKEQVPSCFPCRPILKQNLPFLPCRPSAQLNNLEVFQSREDYNRTLLSITTQY